MNAKWYAAGSLGLLLSVAGAYGQPPADPGSSASPVSVVTRAVSAAAIADAKATILDTHARFGDDLSQRLETDAALRGSYGGAHLMLRQVPVSFPPGSSERASLYNFYRNLISGTLGVNADQFLKPRRYPGSVMAWLREQFYTAWLERLPLNSQRIAEIAALGDFPASYERILASHHV